MEEIQNFKNTKFQKSKIIIKKDIKFEISVKNNILNIGSKLILVIFGKFGKIDFLKIEKSIFWNFCKIENRFFENRFFEISGKTKIQLFEKIWLKTKILVKNGKIRFFLILQLQPWDLSRKIRNLNREKNPLKIVKFAFKNINLVKIQVNIRISVPMLGCVRLC